MQSFATFGRPARRWWWMTALALLVAACWTPSTSVGDYAVTWGDATMTVNGKVFTYSAELGGYVGMAESEDKAQQAVVVLDGADPDAPRPTECWTVADGYLRVCVCTADPETPGKLDGFCESNLLDYETWSISAPDLNAKSGKATKAKLVIGDYEKVSTDAKDLVKTADTLRLRLAFPELAIHLGGAYGIWDLVVGAQEIAVYLEGTPDGDDWTTVEGDPAAASSYEGQFSIWTGFLGWGMGLSFHYSRPFALDQL